MRGIEDLVAGRIPQRGEHLKAHLGEGCADDKNVLVGVFEGANLGGIALVADQECDALFRERTRREQHKNRQAHC
jgi:hypothetical protein